MKPMKAPVAVPLVSIGLDTLGKTGKVTLLFVPPTKEALNKI